MAIKIIGIDGKIYRLETKPSSAPMRTESACKSKLQYECGIFLRSKFPFAPILEEVYIPNHNIYFDFFIPTYNLVVEVDGQQHNAYVPFFHKSEKNFNKSVERDNSKHELCKYNNWELLRVSSLDELKDKLNDF